MNGIASVVVAWNGGRIRLLKPPRAVITRLPRGTAFGLPGDPQGQRRTLETALNLLESPAPQKPVVLQPG